MIKGEHEENQREKRRDSNDVQTIAFRLRSNNNGVAYHPDLHSLSHPPWRLAILDPSKTLNVQIEPRMLIHTRIIPWLLLDVTQKSLQGLYIRHKPQLSHDPFLICKQQRSLR